VHSANRREQRVREPFGFTAPTLSSFSAFTPTEIAPLNEWAAASGLIFIKVATGQGDINFQNVDFNTTSSSSYAGAGGIEFYPFDDRNDWSYPYYVSDLDASGDVFMNFQNIKTDGSVNYGTLLHEIGHAIGLKQPTKVVTDYGAQPTPVVHDQVLLAEGLPAKSYLDTGNRCAFANGGSMVSLHARFDAPKTWRDGWWDVESDAHLLRR
jgi:hypothetical protein